MNEEIPSGVGVVVFTLLCLFLVVSAITAALWGWPVDLTKETAEAGSWGTWPV